MTPEELQAERDDCFYYTESREGSYVLKCKDTEFASEFVEHCKKSKAAFLSSNHWGEILGSNTFAHVFDPVTRYETVLKGHFGSIAGCKLYTNAFVSRQARIGHTSEDVVFVPR